jgi:antitoxin ParD1/3/4
MNISLPDTMRDWVQSRIDSGLYANNSDYMRDLIRRDQERQDKIRALQEAIDAGFASGEAVAFNKEDFKSRMKERLGNGHL